MKTKIKPIKDFFDSSFWNRKVKTDCCGKYKPSMETVTIKKDPKKVARDSVFRDDFSTFERLCIGECD